MHRAGCVRLPLRSAKRPLQASIHKSTESRRLPRFRTASHVDTRARSRFLAQGHEIQQFQLPRATPCVCHVRRCRATPQVTRRHACHAKRVLRARFPTPATQNDHVTRPVRRFSSPIQTAQRLEDTCGRTRAYVNARKHAPTAPATRREHGPPPAPHEKNKKPVATHSGKSILSYMSTKQSSACKGWAEAPPTIRRAGSWQHSNPACERNLHQDRSAGRPRLFEFGGPVIVDVCCVCCDGLHVRTKPSNLLCSTCELMSLHPTRRLKTNTPAIGECVDLATGARFSGNSQPPGLICCVTGSLAGSTTDSSRNGRSSILFQCC